MKLKLSLGTLVMFLALRALHLAITDSHHQQRSLLPVEHGRLERAQDETGQGVLILMGRLQGLISVDTT